jgi:hypothetical protein
MAHVASAVAAAAGVCPGGWAPSTATPRVNGVRRAAVVIPGAGGRRAALEVPSQLAVLSSAVTTGGRGEAGSGYSRMRMTRDGTSTNTRNGAPAYGLPSGSMLMLMLMHYQTCVTQFVVETWSTPGRRV